MKKKNRPPLSKLLTQPAAPVQPTPEPAPEPVPGPVLQGDLFATFLHEAQSLGNEVAARRRFHRDFIEYITSKGLLEDWTKWYEAKHAASKP